MLVVCDGWVVQKHKRKVLSGTDDGGPVSHGLCEVCEREIEVERVRRPISAQFDAAAFDPRTDPEWP